MVTLLVILLVYRSNRALHYDRTHFDTLPLNVTENFIIIGA